MDCTHDKSSRVRAQGGYDEERRDEATECCACGEQWPVAARDEDEGIDDEPVEVEDGE